MLTPVNYSDVLTFSGDDFKIPVGLIVASIRNPKNQRNVIFNPANEKQSQRTMLMLWSAYGVLGLGLKGITGCYKVLKSLYYDRLLKP